MESEIKPESANIVAIRKALTSMADKRRMNLNAVDLEALARAAAEATTWWDQSQLLAVTGQSTARSLSNWCTRRGVVRYYMARRQDVVAAMRAMPGRGHRTDLPESEAV